MLRYEISSEVIELAPGQATQVALTVVNESPLIDFFALTIEPVDDFDTSGLQPGWVSFNPPSFSLRPVLVGSRVTENDSKEEVQMLLMLPQEVVAGTYTGLIRITARSGPDNSLAVPFRLVVSELEQQTLEVRPIEKESRKGTEVFQIFLANEGNAPHLYPVYAEDDQDECRFDVIPGEVLLQPGQSQLLTLKVRPRRRNWADEPNNYDFTVKLEGFPQEAPGRFTQKCAIPPLFWIRRRWVTLVVIFTVLAALAVAAFLFFLPRVTATQAECGPVSQRTFNVVSNDVTTDLLVSGRGGAMPYQKVTTENAEVMPGLFASLVAVSPDGRRLAYVTARNEAMDDARIWVVDLETRQPKQLLASVPSGFWPVAPIWTSDGESLAYVQRSKPDAVATTQAATTAAGTTAATTAAPTQAGGAASALTKLEIWTAKVGDQAKKLETPYKPDVTQFYGDNSPVMCWNKDNASLLFMNKPGVDNTTSDTKITQINASDGTIAQPTMLPGRLGQAAAVLTAQSSPKRNSFAGNPAASNCALAKPFSQNDPRWSDRPLKPGDSSKVGTYGCAFIALATLFNAYGAEVTPADLLNNCVAQSSVLSPLNSDGWVALGQACSGGRAQNGFRTNFNWNQLDDALRSGPAIVGFLGGQTGTHFVVVTGGNGQVAENYQVADPWDGSTYKNLNYFLTKGYRLRWLVTYQGQGLGCPTTAPTNPGIEFNGVTDGGLYQDRINFSLLTSQTVSATVRFRDPKTPPSDLTSTSAVPLNQPVDFTEEGVYSISARQEGRSASPFNNLDFIIDRTPPVITHTITTASVRTDVYQAPVNIRLSALDSLSGIAKIEYKVDEGDWQLYTSDTTSTPFTVKGDGPHTVQYRAQDGAGNQNDQPNTITFTIEQPPPPDAPRTPAVSTANPSPSAGPGGPRGGNTTAGGPGGPQITTVAPVNTTVVVNRPTTPATTVAIPTPVVQPTASPTPIVPTTVQIAATPTVVPPTATPKPNPQLLLSTTQLLFDPNTTSRDLIISNRGTLGNLTWNIVPDANASTYLTFSIDKGSIDPNGSFTLNVVTKLNLTNQPVTASFKVSTNAGEQIVQVSISSQILPVANFLAIPIDQLSSPSILVTLNVVKLTQAKPDHANITVSYGTTAPITVNPNLVPDANGVWSFNLDTTNLPSLTPVTLGGKLCVDAAEKSCTTITPLQNLNFKLDAAITAPSTGSDLPDQDTVNVTGTASARADHIKLVYVYTGITGSAPVTLPTTAKVTNGNWSLNFSSNTITPTVSTVLGPNGLSSTVKNPIQLKGIVCSTAVETADTCRDIPPAGVANNLRKNMKATITFGVPAITSNSTLPNDKLTIKVDNPTSNINHISIYAAYVDAPPNSSGPIWLSGLVPLSRQANGALQPSFDWDLRGLPPQKNIRLAAYACFSADESACLAQGTPLSGLELPNTKPYSVLANNQLQVVRVGSALSTLKLVVRDANGFPVVGKPVTFSTRSCSPGCGNFGGGATSVQPVTDGSGVASTTFTVGGAPFGPYYIDAQIDTQKASYAFWILPSATYSGANTYYYGIAPTPDNYFNGTYNQVAPPNNTVATVGANFPVTYSAFPYSFSPATSGTGSVDISFFLPPDDSGPSAKIISTSGPSNTVAVNQRSVTYNAITAYWVTNALNLYPAVRLQANCVAGTFTMVAVSSSPIVGSGGVIFYPNAFYNFTNQPGNEDATKSFIAPGTSNQQAAIRNGFSQRLRLVVKDSCGNPLSGKNVTFRINAGSGGATAVAAGSLTVVTDSNGVAVAPALTANDIAGAYTVTATIGSGSVAFTFNLTNS